MLITLAKGVENINIFKYMYYHYYYYYRFLLFLYTFVQMSFSFILLLRVSYDTLYEWGSNSAQFTFWSISTMIHSHTLAQHMHKKHMHKHCHTLSHPNSRLLLQQLVWESLLRLVADWSGSGSEYRAEHVCVCVCVCVNETKGNRGWLLLATNKICPLTVN